MGTTRIAERHSLTARWEAQPSWPMLPLWIWDWQKTCWKTYRIRIKTPIKSNMKENPERAPFIFPKAKKATRRLVETVYAQLTERLHIARMKVRDAWHLLNLWHTKILTHTMCVFLNIINYRETA